MIKVIPGETISRIQPAPDKTIIRIQALDIETKEQIDYFEFVLIYVSYKKDRRLPKDKKKLNIKTRIQMKTKKGGLFLVHDTADYRLGWKELKSIMTDKWPVEEYPPLHGLRRL